MNATARKVGPVMLIEGRAIQVNLSRVNVKRDNEGGKWATLGLTTVIGDDRPAEGAIEDAVNLMLAESSLDQVRIDDQMKSVRMEFWPVGAGETGARRVFESTDLFDFKLSREKSTQAGTLRKEKSGRIVLVFHCTVSLHEAGKWALDNFGNDVMVMIQRAQQELPLEGEKSEDTQAARNKRILKGEKEDAKKGASKKKAAKK